MIHSLVIAFPLLVCFAGPDGPDKVTLRFSHTEGSSSSVKSTSKIHQVLSIGGQNFETSVRTVVLLTSSVGKRRSDGRIPIQQTLDGLAVELSLMGVTFAYDSSNPKETEDERFRALIDSFKARVGSSHVIVLGKNNEVIGVEGSEKILEKASPAAVEILRGELKPESLKKSAEQGYGILPTEPVAKGDTWTRSSTLRIGGGQTLKLETRFEYLGTVNRNGTDLDRIGTSVLSANCSLDEDVRSAFKLTQSVLKVESSKGAILFDRVKGQAVESSSSTRLVGDVTLSMNGMDFPAKLELMLETESLVEK